MIKSTELTDKVIMNTLKKNRDILKKYKVKRIGLFGSYVRGEQNEKSDIDFLIEFDLSQFGENFDGLYDIFMDLSKYLKHTFKKQIELITIESLSPHIKKYVEKEVKWYETKSPLSKTYIRRNQLSHR